MSNFHNISSDIKVVHGLTAAITATTVASAAIDTLGYERAMAILYAAPSGVGTSVQFHIQESATSGGSYSFAAIEAAMSVLAGVTGGDDSVEFETPQVGVSAITTAGGAQLYVVDINLNKRQRFLELEFVGTGASAAGQAYATLLLGRARHLMVPQANAAYSVN